MTASRARFLSKLYRRIIYILFEQQLNNIFNTIIYICLAQRKHSEIICFYGRWGFFFFFLVLRVFRSNPMKFMIMFWIMEGFFFFVYSILYNKRLLFCPHTHTYTYFGRYIQVKAYNDGVVCIHTKCFICVKTT